MPGTARYDDARKILITEGLDGAEHQFSPNGLTALTKVFRIGNFTDNTDATGYVDFADALPTFHMVQAIKIKTLIGFTGDTTAVIKAGVSGALDDLSVSTTQSVLAAGTIVLTPKTYALSYSTAARTVRLTVTGGADFTSITAGKLRATIYYFGMAAFLQ